MLRLVLYFVLWVALGSLVYFKLTPGALVAYGVGSMVAVLAWAVGRGK